jgi:asparagine synthase (glutamine-hydrolysing)
MCGLTGFWQTCNFSADTAQTVVESMADRIAHRGPDDSGVWVDESVGIALAHRRLSILDLSPEGYQPMASPSGRYVVVFNGEIYNHLEIRKKLAVDSQQSIEWRGHSDTETLLAAFTEWGVEKTLKTCVGMFAIALWDREEKVLTLARDRMGEKPLYYGFQNETLLFGSELKALKAHPAFIGEIDRDVLCLYLRHCCIPAPYSIYKGMQKLLPGSFIQFPLAQTSGELRSVTPVVYWSLAEVAATGIAQPFRGSDTDAVTALDGQLKQAIGLQMIADVPLGAFLSGGIDSSTVVALMQAQSSRPVKTFSIGFDEAGYNEAVHAKAVAQHLGTDHTEYYVSSEEAMQVIPQLGKMYDEPFADSSQIPTFLVSQMARKDVTVSLSGDGGDELFCGYNRYALTDIWDKVSKVPFGARRATGRLIKSVKPSVWEAVFQQMGRVKRLPPNMAEKLGKFATRLQDVDSTSELYYSLVSEVANPEQVVIGAKEPESWLTKEGINASFDNAKLHMMYMDAMTYLPDDILVKVDRAAMFNSLETRVPLLDHRVVELAWSLPMSMKMRDGQSKWLLRQVLYQYVPKELIERPKMGFGIPVGEWMRGPLKAWVEELLDESRLRQEGFFNVQLIRLRWQEHLSGKRNWQYFLWSVLMFQAWLTEEQS